MNIKEYINYAKKVLNEDAGSEGMQYTVKVKSGLKALETNVLTIDEIKDTNEGQTGRVQFSYPHDWGYAHKVLQENLPDVEILGLELVF